MTTLTAALLAGGESRRMGADKATLLLDGTPLWSRQLDILRGLNPAKILVSARIRPSWLPADVDLALDEPPARGPLSGLAAALARTETTHLIALAVDLPRMTTEKLRSIAAQARPRTAVIPVLDGQPQPLGAVYPVEARGVAEETLAGADVSMRRFIENLRKRNEVDFYPVGESERDLFRNLNTAAEAADLITPPSR